MSGRWVVMANCRDSRGRGVKNSVYGTYETFDEAANVVRKLLADDRIGWAHVQEPPADRLAEQHDEQPYGGAA